MIIVAKDITIEKSNNEVIDILICRDTDEVQNTTSNAGDVLS